LRRVRFDWFGSDYSMGLLPLRENYRRWWGILRLDVACPTVAGFVGLAAVPLSCGLTRGAVKGEPRLVVRASDGQQLSLTATSG